MTQKFVIIGASSLVGNEILNILSENDVATVNVTALTTARASGKAISYGDHDLKTIDIDKFEFNDMQTVFIAEKIGDIESILETGAKVIDCIGGDMDHQNLTQIPVANALQILETLAPLHANTPIKRVVVSTYQATSLAGKAGMDELFNQSRKFFVTDGLENDVFAKQISFNVIPHVGNFTDDGQTDAEWQIAVDVKKHLNKDIKVSATCVTVPVFIGTGMAINVKFHDEMNVKTAKSLWREAEGVVIIDENSEMEYVTPAEIAGEDHVYVSRLRNDSSIDNGLSFWCAADNVRFVAIKATMTAFQS